MIVKIVLQATYFIEKGLLAIIKLYTVLKIENWRVNVHKIDLSGNKFQIQRFVLLQIVLALFTILFTYKWAYQTTHIIEQNLVMNLILDL